MASTSTSDGSVEWSCREIDIKEKCLEDILKYLNNRCLKYYWALFYHDGSVDCEILNEFGGKYQYYHMFIWYKKEPKLEKKNRISVIFLSCNMLEEYICHMVKSYILLFLICWM